jgi:subtilisin-like proprotein convertase family protein
VVYQCLTGAVPFDKETEVATLFAHLQDPLPKVSDVRPDVPDEVDEVVARGMAKDREERYPTCTAMMDVFVEAVGLTVAREPVPFDPTVVAAPPQQPDSGPLLPPAPAAAAAAAATSGSTPPIERPVTAEPARQAPAGTGGPPKKGSSRLAAIIGGSVLGLAAIVVAIVLLSGGDGPGPNPTRDTGTTGTTGSTGDVVSSLELSGGSVIDIPRRGTGVPYPSTLRVSDVEGVITDVNVTLEGFAHTFPSDLDVLLVGPGGQSVILMEGVGSDADVQDVTLTFDDDGTPLAADQPLTSATFLPSSNAGDGFGFNGPGAVPPAPYASALGVFDGTDPNGTWSLYVFDDGPDDAGQIAGGWSLELELAGEDDVFLADDMSDPASGWNVFDESGSYGLYRNGEYVLGLPGAFQVNVQTNTTPELATLSDVRVEATGRLLGSRNALYGVLCRASSQLDYYYFLVQGDGTYYIGESVGGTASNFSSSFTPAIVPGQAPNRISAECFDDPGGGVTLRLFVNGLPVDTVIDSIQPFTSGTIGLRAEARRGPMEAAFDDVLVTAPVGGAAD